MMQSWNTRLAMRFNPHKKSPAQCEAFLVHRREDLSFLHFFKIHIGHFGIAVC